MCDAYQQNAMVQKITKFVARRHIPKAQYLHSESVISKSYCASEKSKQATTIIFNITLK